jgi:hypothetical protein
VIILATNATILLAIASYAAFKLRDRRKPKAQQGPAPVFFRRYRPEEPDARPAKEEGGR